MNTRAVRWLVGGLSMLLGAALLVPTAVALAYGELHVAEAFVLSVLVAIALGAILMLTNRGSLRDRRGRPMFFKREGIAVVALGWMLAAVLGALPFLFSGTIRSLAGALFESTSGITTTGATVLSAAEVDALPKGIAFWRCFSHWIGGIGIVLVFVAILPTGGRFLFRSEGLRQTESARVRDSALSLLRVYVILTVAHAALLVVAGMSTFDAVIHSFSSMATGGFSNRGASIAYYHSPWIEAVIVVFMIAAGTNFAVWELTFRLGPRKGLLRAWEFSEVRAYVLLLFGGSLLLTLILWFWGGSNGEGGSLPDYSGFTHCLRDATFNLVSIQTCTGYATADFDRWPDACRMLLMALAAVGGCAGSTSGGIKVVRLVLAWRAAVAAVRSFARPRAVVTVELDGRAVDGLTIASATRFFALWFMVAIAGALTLSLLGVDATSAVTGTISCLNNVGPGLGGLGPAQCYGALGFASKMVLCGLMILGRLEFFALIALVSPEFWRR